MAITPRSIDAGVGIGEIFVEKYRVDAILGHGGMGVVALCTHLTLNERVAIKMLRRDVLDDEAAVERFMREAQAAVKLKSEFVARVTDVGRSPSNVPYMVMEYLEGYDLGELLEERGNLGQPWAIELTLQACEALAEAHSLGIVHRDVKPANLFVTWRPDGSPLVKVLDFGISKGPTVSTMQLTQTQSLLGTPAYMSPEQTRSARTVDARTDIWSLGTVLYEMLEGRRPFEAESFSEMCVKVAVEPPAAMTSAPLPLQQVVLRCLEKAPEQRYASMAELALDLVPFSHDPHQAQVLAERMVRMLRRSEVQPAVWSASGPLQKVPSAERPVQTTPRDAAGGAGLAAASSGAAIPLPMQLQPSGSGPAIRLPATGRRGDARPLATETMAVTRPRRRRPLLIASALVLAAATGVAISLARRPEPRGSRPTATDRARSVPPASHAAAPPASPPSRGSAGDSPGSTDGHVATGSAAGPPAPEAAGPTENSAGDPAGDPSATPRDGAGPGDPKLPTHAPGSTPARTGRRDPARASNAPASAPKQTEPAGKPQGSGDCAFDGPHSSSCRPDAGAQP